MSPRFRRAFVVVVAAVGPWAASSAHAHPVVDEGLEHLRAADFREAVAAFDRAEGATDLALADLRVLLEGRAMAALAMGDEAAVASNLRRLAAIEPEHRFGAEAPPEIRAAFEHALREGNGRVALEIQASRHAAAVDLGVAVRGDPGGLVRSVELSARVGSGAWQSWGERSAHVRARADQVVLARASAHGPGGTVIAEAERRLAPAPAGATGGPVGGSARERDHDEGSSASTWAWVGAGAALVAAAVIVTVVATSSSGTSDVTQPGAPEMPR